MNKLFLVVLVTFFAGCATPYQQAGFFRKGYSSTQIQEGVFRVRFHGNASTSGSRAMDFAILRSAELTLAHGYRYFVILGENEEVSTAAISTPVMANTTGSISMFGNSNSATGFYSGSTTYSGGSSYILHAPLETLTIQCFNAKPNTSSMIYDAEQVNIDIKRSYGIENQPSLGLTTPAETAAQYDEGGLAYAKQGNFTQAIPDFTKAIEIDPNDVKAYSMRGACYTKQNNYAQAIADYTKAIEINPNLAPIYEGRGFAYGKQGNYNQAIVDCNKAIEINSTNAEFYDVRGFVYFEMGNLNQAITDYNQAIQIDPNHVDAHYDRGLAYYSLEQYDKALVDYAKATGLKNKKEAYDVFIKYVPARKASDMANVRDVILKLLDQKQS